MVLFHLWCPCLDTETCVGARLYPLGGQTRGLHSSRCLSARLQAASPCPALPQPQRSEDQIWKCDQFHRANQNMLHGHSSSGVGAACVELSSGRAACPKYTFTAAGRAPAAHRTEDALAWRRGSHCLLRNEVGEKNRRCEDWVHPWALTCLSPFSQGTDKAP